MSTKLNLDDLFETKKEYDLLTLKNYNLILDRAHKQIKVASRQKSECCWFVVPEFILGIPRYDTRSCVAYVIHQLEENGFKLTYTHPNLLFISWSHWIPDYVRLEYKKQTGTIIDGFGKEVKKEEPKKSVLKSTSAYKPTGLIYQDDFIKLS
jgi:hypothetical protein